MGEEIYGQHETRQAGPGKWRGGREGGFLTSFISVRKDFESVLEAGKPLQAAWAPGEVASREPQHAEHSWPQPPTSIPSSRSCCSLYKLCLNKCSNTKMALPATQAHLSHTQSSLCDKILPRLWKPPVLSVLTVQTQVWVSWVVHGLWSIRSTRVGGGALVWWHPHHKVIFLLLCPTKASSPWNFHMECFPFVPPKKLALFSLGFGCFHKFSGPRQNKILLLKTIQNNARDIFLLM